MNIMKKHRGFRLLSLLLTFALILVLCAACGGNADVAATPSAESQEQQEAVATADTEASVQNEGPGMEDISSSEPEVLIQSALPESYPLICDDGSARLSFFWMTFGTGLFETDYNDLYFWQELSRRTGVSFDWTMVQIMNGATQLELLIAANDLPNIVSCGFTYTRGITAGIEDGTFVNIEPYLQDYAPDYYQVVQRPDVHPAVSDMDGNMIGFYEIMGEKFPPSSGVAIRGDLLDDLGVEAPVTYDEYEDVLLRMKDEQGIESPITLFSKPYLWLSAGKHVSMEYSLDADGNCIYGPVEDGFREYLIFMNRWYSEGILQNDYFSIPDQLGGDTMIQHLSSGQSAVAFLSCDQVGQVSIDDPNAYLTAGHFPRDNKDDQLHLTDGTTDTINTAAMCAISASSTEEEVQLACMLLNYFYTEEGSLMLNYGTEGVSFEYRDDGTPWFTDLVLNNPDGLTQMQALITYATFYTPGLSDDAKYNISAVTTYSDFVKIWGETDNADDMPPVSLTAEEQDAVNQVYGDVSTYLSEVVAKFIIGDMDPGDDTVWQDYLDKMDALGVQDMIEGYSAALERYKNNT